MFGSKWSSQEQLVAQDWIERASRKTQLGRHCNCCPRLCYKRACVESLYMYCGALFLISLALFIILAAGIVAPFHKSLDFVVTRCTTLSSTITGKPQVCLCSGHHCQSSYPCTSIQVTFNTTEGEHEEAQLHHTQYNTGRCTYSPQCYRSAEKNKLKVDEFLATYGDTNATYECLYNPHDVTRVIQVREGHKDSMFYMLLIPALVGGVCAMGVVIPYLACGCSFLWRRQPPQSIRQEAENRARGIVLSEYAHMDPGKETE